MCSCLQETLDGYNSYVKTLREDDNEYFFNFLKFQSSIVGSIEIVHQRAKMADVPELTNQTYSPSSMTPLIDACVKTIHATEKVANDHPDSPVLVVFQTDGMENTSTEYEQPDLAKLIQDKEALGWTFLFMGANIDAYDQAGQLGISAAHTMSYTGARSKDAMDSFASNTVEYASSGGDATMANFSDDQKTNSGDAYHKDPVTTAVKPHIPSPKPGTSTKTKKKPSLVSDVTL